MQGRQRSLRPAGRRDRNRRPGRPVLALIQDPNFDQGDGQGFWNQVRTDAALELAQWLQTNPTGATSTDNLVLLRRSQFLRDGRPGAGAHRGGLHRPRPGADQARGYSYVFDGQQGTLDYGLASEGLRDNVTGAAEWHINADEPDLLSYDSTFNDPAFYNDDAFAVSDHDPMLIGLTLDDPAVTARYEFTSNCRDTKDRVIYFEDGEKLDVARVDGPQKVLNLHQDGLYIDGFDHLKGKDLLTINQYGLGVWSKYGDLRKDGSPRKLEGNMLDDEESIVFHLTDKEHVGDALGVEFEFGKVRGVGEVTLTFREDGVVVDEVDLTIVDNRVAYDLAGNTSFDEVEIEVGDCTMVAISAIELDRLAPADQFEFIGL
ncbi:MAG: hypothetical protein R3D80_12755 [Paracoccaceae bacterium]